MSQTLQCFECKKIFPLSISFYHRDKSQKCGFHNKCKECWKRYNKLRKPRHLPQTSGHKTCIYCEQKKHRTLFNKNYSNNDGRQSYCKNCSNYLGAAKRTLNHLTIQFKSNKEKVNYVSEIVNKLRKEQKNICPICKNVFKNKGQIDHCHSNGHVRGILCNSCNMYILPILELFVYTGHDKIDWKLFPNVNDDFKIKIKNAIKYIKNDKKKNWN